MLPTFVSISLLCQAQQSYDYKVHANILYHFTKYIEWPYEVPPSETLVIGIIGDRLLYNELKVLTTNKVVGDQKIVVRNISIDGPFDACDMLFLSPGESTHFKKVELLTRNQPVLLITENTGLARRGSSINFVSVNNRLKLEINKRNILSKKLNIASELLQLGTVVN